MYGILPYGCISILSSNTKTDGGIMTVGAAGYEGWKTYGSGRTPSSTGRCIEGEGWLKFHSVAAGVSSKSSLDPMIIQVTRIPAINPKMDQKQRIEAAAQVATATSQYFLM